MKIIKKLILLCMVLVANFPLTAIQIDSLQLADSLFLNFQYEPAMEMFYSLQRKTPENAGLAYKLAYCFEQLSNDRDAEIFYQRAIQFKPDHIPALRQLALLANKTGKPNDAIQYIKQILSIDSLNGYYHYLLGNNYIRINETAAAINSFHHSIQLNNKDIKPVLALAEIFYSSGKFEKAVEVATKSPAYNSNDTRLKYLAGKAFFKLKKYNEVIECGLSALKIDPDSTLWDQYIGYSYFLNTDYIACIPWLMHALQEKTITEAGLSYLASAQQQLGNKGLALMYFEMAAELSRSEMYENNLQNIGLLYLESGKYKQALRTMEQAYYYNLNPIILYNLGVIAYEKKDYTNARKYWNKYLSTGDKKYYTETKRIILSMKKK